MRTSRRGSEKAKQQIQESKRELFQTTLTSQHIWQDPKMKDRLRVAVRPSPVIVGVFRVCYITNHSRLRGGTSFTLLLASPTRLYVSIAGQFCADVSFGDLV